MTRTTLTLTLLASVTLPACAKRAPEGSMAPAASYDSAAGAGAGRARRDVAAAEAAPTATVSEESAALVMADEDADGARFDDRMQPGRLTAGTFDDTLNGATFSSFMRAMADNPATGDVARFFGGPITTVAVVDQSGRAVADARVAIRSGGATRTVLTGTDGRAIIIAGYDHAADEPLQVALDNGDWTAVRQGASRTLVSTALATPVRGLDIALVIDATGSMSDELEYLKVELRGIAQEVQREFPNVDQRFALVVYRDHGDDYVTRKFDFTGKLTDFERVLGRQSAGGGGDYPEAMDAALQDTNQLSWRTGPGTARVAFLIADAPPHAADMVGTMTAVETMRGKGVAVYPVAASGVADEAEMVMRAAAASTGGQYLFLTDDAGVGDSHAEPHIPCYAVEPLRTAMSRMLEGELSGKRIEADPQRLIRQVGSSDAGVCAPLRVAQ